MLMVLLPVLLLVLVPRMTSAMDKDQRENMEQMQSMFNQRPSDMFDISAWLQKFFSGGSSGKRSSSSKTSKKSSSKNK
jgi:competence protein ComGC